MNPRIPEEWETIILGDLYEFSNGVNADKSAYGSGIPFVNVLEVINHETLNDSFIPGRITLPPAFAARYQVRHGDVLFNRTSETQEEVGLSSVYLGESKVVFGGFVFRAHPKTNRLTVTYAPYALRARSVREQITARGQGGIRANISQRDLKTVTVPLPTVPEQCAIAEMLNDASDHIKLLEHLIVKKQTVKQGMAQQLLTGRTRLPGFTKPWQKASLGDFTVVDPETLASGTDSKKVIDYISLEDVERGEIHGHTTMTFGAAPSRARRVIRLGDVLFGTVRPNLQSHAMYIGGLGHPVASTGFAVVRTEKAYPQFIFYLLMSHMTSKQIERIIAGSNYPAVSSTDVRRLTFAMPSLNEQQAIGSILADSDREISMLKSRLAKTKAIKHGMMQQLLTGRTRLPV